MLLVYCSIRKALCLALRVHSRGIFVHLFSGHFGFSLGVKAISDSSHIVLQYWIVLYVYAFPSTRSAVSGRYTGALEEAIIGFLHRLEHYPCVFHERFAIASIGALALRRCCLNKHPSSEVPPHQGTHWAVVTNQ